MKFLAVAIALVASFFAVGTAIFVSYDSYFIVLRQIALLLVPWVAVWAAFRDAYKIVAGCFAVTTVVAYWLAETVWGIPLVGALLVGATLIRDRSRENS